MLYFELHLFLITCYSLILPGISIKASVETKPGQNLCSSLRKTFVLPAAAGEYTITNTNPHLISLSIPLWMRARF